MPNSPCSSRSHPIYQCIGYHKLGFDSALTGRWEGIEWELNGNYPLEVVKTTNNNLDRKPFPTITLLSLLIETKESFGFCKTKPLFYTIYIVGANFRHKNRTLFDNNYPSPDSSGNPLVPAFGTKDYFTMFLFFIRGQRNSFETDSRK